MRLESIQLAGFKSFVDPTIVSFPTNLTAVVGPNGCGKSNIIDAIRWVMGESSAKQLRGESLDDVIFNGCHTRKPLGRASIELHFDNTDGSLGGQYSSYAHLSIRREITREGQSIYSLNGTRCRRRDIRDIFLGTGLGPRSYAIIEQGMISRIVEAKPEELRSYIEEAAGISKYKERRRETELRLTHTQENLNRLNDLKEELRKQLKHLQRQANTAERYKALKQEERFLKAQLQTLRYQTFQEELQSQLANIQSIEEQLNLSQHEHQQVLEQMTHFRNQQVQMRLTCDSIQTEYYTLGNEITRSEENLRTQMSQLQQNKQELTDLTQKKTALEQQCQHHEALQIQINQKLSELQQQYAEREADTQKSQDSLNHAKTQYTNWQTQWETIQIAFFKRQQHHHFVATQQDDYQTQSETLRLRIKNLQAEHDEYTKRFTSFEKNPENFDEMLTSVSEKQSQCKHQLQQITQHILDKRRSFQQIILELDQLKSRQQIMQGEYASLMALQQEALGKREETLLEWFKKYNLIEQPRLAQLIHVETGWERAVEVALNQHIQAVCLTDRDSLDDFLNNPPPHTVSFMTKSKPCDYLATAFQKHLTLAPISSKLTAPWPLEHLLAGIYVAENVSEAMQHTPQLKSFESIITREGICLGNHWIHLTAHTDHKAGLLQREREIAQLHLDQRVIQEQLDNKQQIYQQLQKQLHELEAAQTLQQQLSADYITQQADLSARQKVKHAQINQAQQHLLKLEKELKETDRLYKTTEEKLQQSIKEKKTADTALKQIEKQRLEHLENKEKRERHYNESARIAKMHEKELHQHALYLQETQHQLKTECTHLTNLKQQYHPLEQRLIQLQHQLNAENSIDSLQQQLNASMSKRDTLHLQLKENKTQLETIERHIKHAEERLHTLENRLNSDRNTLEQQRLFSQELHVRSKTLEEQLKEQGFELKKLLSDNPILNRDITECEKKLTEIIQRIEHMGAVNLAALEEQQVVLEREHYLEKQHQDLSEALETLHTAIQKMDKETRMRFKETFDKINHNFMTLFPRLFSGGTASLQCHDPHSPSSGLCIMAQPPGKRNSTIHLLSGGEKALTAIAFVFSFFQLNPAPFCMLDEVDAPLDDTNVLRFCKLVKEMSNEIQFIFISHNKVAIEMAHHLTGVTMHEPGVSRLVAVDLEKAIAMATT
ncbi:chromosome segregation protein SMC [Rickettsiella grylli]|uniref:chromosome segregation protein SMC n=1 Tax=Rickettsiella grylli TaxID=59196 RepID=UPI0008FD223B|nr:chromosome segregation protein SMC [Rickettsiella grylli]OJA00073.1 chromosome segregation protein SMC [Rickettsiella grylli]